MVRNVSSPRELFLSRDTVVAFAIQMTLFVGMFVAPVGRLEGLWVVMSPVIEATHLLNSVTDLLFAPRYDGLLDPLFTILLVPVVCYLIAVLFGAFTRAVRHRSSGVGQ